MRAKCWLIVERDRRFSSNIMPAVKLRGMEAEACTLDDGHLPDLPAGSGSLVVMDFASLQRLSPLDRIKLSQQVAAGTTLYVNGRVSDGQRYSLAPFAPGEFQVDSGESSSYSLCSHPLLPTALRGEHSAGRFFIPVAHGLPKLAKPLLVARDQVGTLFPSVFAIEQGRGAVIYDLNGEQNQPSCLQSLLENPLTRPGAVAPLVAADRAAGCDPSLSAAFAIVIDDRPINLDYFNVRSLRAFLQRLERCCPGVHVDFAWTPDQNRPSYRYVQTLKQFNTGFVWHGLLHHIDHRTIADPETDLAHGRRLVADISRRYSVEFQPVMIFPYENQSEASVTLIKREGFIAKAESVTSPMEHSCYVEPAVPAESDRAGFATLWRSPLATLSRDRMLAEAALGKAIIAAAHPSDIALQRFAGLRSNCGSLSRLDQILEFAAAKRLRLQSLQRIAEDQLSGIPG